MAATVWQFFTTDPMCTGPRCLGDAPAHTSPPHGGDGPYRRYDVLCPCHWHTAKHPPSDSSGISGRASDMVMLPLRNPVARTPVHLAMAPLCQWMVRHRCGGSFQPTRFFLHNTVPKGTRWGYKQQGLVSYSASCLGVAPCPLSYLGKPNLVSTRGPAAAGGQGRVRVGRSSGSLALPRTHGRAGTDGTPHASINTDTNNQPLPPAAPSPFPHHTRKGKRTRRPWAATETQ